MRSSIIKRCDRDIEDLEKLDNASKLGYPRGFDFLLQN